MRTLRPLGTTLYHAPARRSPHASTVLRNVDEKIAKQAVLRPIAELVADKLGLDGSQDIEAYGRYKAKLTRSAVEGKACAGKLVLVTALTPTKAGEGKTCTSVGLADGLNKVGAKAMVALREPSLGPVFGMKGGAAGGGYAQVVPMADINLHFTGDLHAIGAAHNLLSAMVDNHIHWGSDPVLDVRRVEWKRVLDMNDRALRHIAIGLGGVGNGFPREDGFDITVASEVMAIFCLASSEQDLRERLGKVIVGYQRDGKTPVTAKELEADGAMAALLKDAFMPNIVQTLEQNLAIIHGGPFANIAHGCSSVVGTKASLALADYVVTEAGFGADLGAEKFFDIKCRKSGLAPSCAVVVATVRALKLHGGVDAKEISQPNVDAVEKGMPNLLRHVSNVAKFGVRSVVALNKFTRDSPEEVDTVVRMCQEAGITAVVADQWAQGGEGTRALAEQVISLCETPGEFKLLYPDSASLKEKVETVAKEIYHAGDVSYSSTASTKLARFTKMGYGHLPICIAKTQYSFSNNPKLVNAPSGHTLNVQDVRLSAGAEFVVVLTGTIMTMPGLPRRPSAANITVDDSGEIVGLF